MVGVGWGGSLEGLEAAEPPSARPTRLLVVAHAAGPISHIPQWKPTSQQLVSGCSGFSDCSFCSLTVQPRTTDGQPHHQAKHATTLSSQTVYKDEQSHHGVKRPLVDELFMA